MLISDPLSSVPILWLSWTCWLIIHSLISTYVAASGHSGLAHTIIAINVYTYISLVFIFLVHENQNKDLCSSLVHSLNGETTWNMPLYYQYWKNNGKRGEQLVHAVSIRSLSHFICSHLHPYGTPIKSALSIHKHITGELLNGFSQNSVWMLCQWRLVQIFTSATNGLPRGEADLQKTKFFKWDTEIKQ
jgi:hypothetical protein